MNEHPRDERAERRERRREANRRRMKKHGAGTSAVYRDAILKRLMYKAGKRKQ
jgi:hypothetical protein